MREVSVTFSSLSLLSLLSLFFFFLTIRHLFVNLSQICKLLFLHLAIIFFYTSIMKDCAKFFIICQVKKINSRIEISDERKTKFTLS